MKLEFIVGKVGELKVLFFKFFLFCFGVEFDNLIIFFLDKIFVNGIIKLWIFVIFIINIVGS